MTLFPILTDELIISNFYVFKIKKNCAEDLSSIFKLLTKLGIYKVNSNNPTNHYNTYHNKNYG